MPHASDYQDDDQYDDEFDDLYDGEDEDGFDYDDYVRREFGGTGDGSGGGITNRNTKFIWRLTAIILLLVFLLFLI